MKNNLANKIDPSSTPWKLVTEGFKNGFASIETEDGGYEVVSSCRHDNAAFIVKACNSHYRLTKFIESITDANGPYQDLDGHKIVAAARTVLGGVK